MLKTTCKKVDTLTIEVKFRDGVYLKTVISPTEDKVREEEVLRAYRDMVDQAE
jgi:hypothetical protein